MGHKRVWAPSDCHFFVVPCACPKSHGIWQTLSPKNSAYIVFRRVFGRYTTRLFVIQRPKTLRRLRETVVYRNLTLSLKNRRYAGENVRYIRIAYWVWLIPRKKRRGAKPLWSRPTPPLVNNGLRDNAEITVTLKWQDWVDYFNEELPLDMVLRRIGGGFWTHQIIILLKVFKIVRYPRGGRSRLSSD